MLSAVGFAGLILGAASAAVPLFESSVASAANPKHGIQVHDGVVVKEVA